MKIALAQLNFHIGNFENNTGKIIDAIRQAKVAGADLVVFAELAVSGYPPRDFLEFHDFIRLCHESIEKISIECRGIAAIVGAPSINKAPEGKNLFNSAWFLHEGSVVSVHHKGLLPNYDVFDEYRYFEPAREFSTVDYKGIRLAITVCEDIWDVGEDLMYTVQPMDVMSGENPDIMINIAASPFDYGHAARRKDVLRRNVLRYGIPIVYVNHTGAQTELLFDGGSMVMASDGRVLNECPYFAEDMLIWDSSDQHQQLRENDHANKYALIHDALVMGIRNYFSKLGFKQAILGLSGGIDSALTLVLACEALGEENVISLLLPSRYSSNHSIDDSLLLLKNLGSPHHILSIEDGFAAMESTLMPHFTDRKPDLTEENIQARLRAVLLMAFSNKFGYILLNTSNKSEAAVGYGTLYGDMCGGISVLGDVYKTEVYKLAEYINRKREIIPKNIISKAPSAELRHDQKDSDSLPEYDMLDPILFEYIEQKKSPAQIISMGFSEDLVRRILKLVNTNEYKRYQSPPILRVSPKAFGMGRRMPIVGKYLS
jgi:NAD+ synthase (glutamine-hydrolysing)